MASPPQSESDMEPPPSPLPPPHANAPVRPFLPAPPMPSAAAPMLEALLGTVSTPRAAPDGSGVPTLPPWGGGTSNPLHPPVNARTNIASELTRAIPVIMACIDMAVTIMHMYTTSAEESKTQLPKKRKKRKWSEEHGIGEAPNTFARHEPEEDELEHPHTRDLFDLLAWHVHVADAKWYVKPRSTCWFDEYLFNIYTPDMFYDILRMRRTTFDRLVNNLRPLIQGQHTHWREPIAVEKKVVVTLFKLMHGVSIPLVANKAAIGKSMVHQILRQVCSAISTNFAHHIAWPAGRRLARVTSAFQTKQWFPNCIGAIDGSHVYIQAPPNSIVAADHRNRYKSFSILLQGVVDTKCYFTSVNIGPPGSLHDSAHFKSSELYRRVEEGTMSGFHDDPMTWPAALPFPPYIVADRGYPLLSWCITPFKTGPMGQPLTAEEAWFNRKHSSTRMSVERGFGILKARFKEIGSKTSLKLDFVPTVVHTCCILHNILLASKDRTLDQILMDCHLPPMDVHDTTRTEEDNAFRPPRPMGLVSEERSLLEGKMAREDILDYLVRIQNADHIARHPQRT